MNEQRIFKAESYFELGRYAEALKESTACLQEDPELERALYLAGLSALHLDRLDEAERFAKVLIRAHPDSSVGYEVMAHVAVQKKQDLLAEDMYFEALKRDPEHPHYFALLARFVGSKNRIEEALAMIHKGLAIDPEHLQLLKLAALFYTRNDEPEKAVEYSTKALACNPEDSDVHLIAGLVLLEKGEAPSARYNLRESVRLNPAMGDDLSVIAAEQARTHPFFKHAQFLPTERLAVIAALSTPIFWALLGILWSGFFYLSYLSIVILILWYGYYGLYCLYKRHLLKEIKRGRL